MNSQPILIIPYMWIGDFVRCHTVVRVLRERHPHAPIDMLTTSVAAPLIDYMPEVRKGIAVDLPRKRVAFGEHAALARRLAREGYAQALIMPRTWKSALAPYLAGIPRRTAFLGEARLGLVNDLRFGERRLPRMVDRCAALALSRDETLPAAWPAPQLRVPPHAIADWRERSNLAGSPPAIAFAPGAVGPSKRWPSKHYLQLARALVAQGYAVWILGGPEETQTAAQLSSADPTSIRDLTGPDLRNAILAIAAAQAVVSNDSGLLHVAAALGRPAVGIFGPTSPWHWAPLNPISAAMETTTELSCRPCHQPVCGPGHHRCMLDISPERVMAAITQAVGPVDQTQPALLQRKA
jgi:heptosyltransferase-2